MTTAKKEELKKYYKLYSPKFKMMSKIIEVESKYGVLGEGKNKTVLLAKYYFKMLTQQAQETFKLLIEKSNKLKEQYEQLIGNSFEVSMSYGSGASYPKTIKTELFKVYNKDFKLVITESNPNNYTFQIESLDDKLSLSDFEFYVKINDNDMLTIVGDDDYILEKNYEGELDLEKHIKITSLQKSNN